MLPPFASVVVRVQVIFVGHSSDSTGLAAIGLATFFCNVTGIYFCNMLLDWTTQAERAAPVCFVFEIFFNVWFSGGYQLLKRLVTSLAVGACDFRAGYSIAVNLQTAFDTLGSQAYGAKNYPRVGLLWQRTLFVMALLCVPVSERLECYMPLVYNLLGVLVRYNTACVRPHVLMVWWETEWVHASRLAGSSTS